MFYLRLKPTMVPIIMVTPISYKSEENVTRTGTVAAIDRAAAGKAGAEEGEKG